MVEASPAFSLEHQQDGDMEKLLLQVGLPGVADSSEIVFTIQDPRHLLVHVPGRYRAEVQLPVDVERKAEAVRFLKEDGALKATLVVAGRSGTPPTQDVSAQRQPAAGGAGGGAAPAEPPQPPGQPQRPRPQQQGQGGAAAAAALPAEQLDEAMYAAAAAQANREAAAECFALAVEAQRAGDVERARRLLSKACRLDGGSSPYAAALEAVFDSSAAPGGAQAGDSGAGSGASDGAQPPAPAGGTGAAAGSAERPPQPQRHRQRQPPQEPPPPAQQQQEGRRQQQARAAGQPERRRQQQERERQLAAAAQQERRRQQQERERQEAAEAAALEAAMQAAMVRQAERKTRRAMLQFSVVGLLCLAVALAALYHLLRLAPPAAGGWAAAGGWRAAVSRAAAPVLFLPRVLFWRPTAAMAFLWALAAGSAATGARCLARVLGLAGWQLPVELTIYARLMSAGWYALFWLACGGGWWSVLGHAGKLASLDHYLGKSAERRIMLYPLACLAARLAAGWLLLPAAGLGLRLLMPPLRLIIWQPRWWLNAPVAAAAAWSCAGRGPLARPGSEQRAWAPLATNVGGWWLIGGGRWAVAFTVWEAAAAAAAMVAVHRGHWSLEAWLSRNFYGTPLPPLVLRLLTVWWAGAGGSLACLGALAAAAAAYVFLPPPLGDRAFGGGRRQSAGAQPSASRHLHHEVPAGAPEEVARILQAGNFYQVLGVEPNADEAAIKRAKRLLSLATHPDKVGAAAGATEAFNLVTEACEVLADAKLRQQYDEQLAVIDLASCFDAPEYMAGAGIPPEFAHRAKDLLDAVLAGDLPQRCDACGDIHFLRRTDRPPAAARQCDECGVRHAVRDDEVWFEGARAGFLRRTLQMFCCHEGVVYDMSEVGACNGVLRAVHQAGLPQNPHNNYARASGGSRGGDAKRGRGAGQQGRAQGRGGGGGKKKGRRR